MGKKTICIKSCMALKCGAPNRVEKYEEIDCNVFFFVQHDKRCIGLATNVTLNCSIVVQSKHLYNIHMTLFYELFGIN